MLISFVVCSIILAVKRRLTFKRMLQGIPLCREVRGSYLERDAKDNNMGMSVAGVAHLERQLGPELARLLVDPTNTGRIQIFLKKLKTVGDKLLPSWIEEEEDAIALLVAHKIYDEEMAKAVVEKWVEDATDYDYDGPVLWQVPAGFTLIEHAALAGPCKDFGALQEWKFTDEPTRSALVFWIPRLITSSKGLNAGAQRELLKTERQRLELPDHHLRSFGSAALVAALILAHFKRTAKRVPLKGNWARTDTQREDLQRIRFGNFGKPGLECHYRWGNQTHKGLGVFPLGIEPLKSE